MHMGLLDFNRWAYVNLKSEYVYKPKFKLGVETEKSIQQQRSITPTVTSSNQPTNFTSAGIEWINQKKPHGSRDAESPKYIAMLHR